MSQNDVKKRRNDIARLLDYPDRVHRNCVRINPHNALEHELEKVRQCYELRRKDQEFFTEATFLPTELGGSGRGRADILVLDTKTVIEILNDETEEECGEKFMKYPGYLGLIMVRVKKTCMWKKVSDSDKKKIEEGKKNITFGPDSPCHACDGLNTKCETYRGDRYAGQKP